MKKNNPILLITVGFPGSGKTYFSEQFSKKNRFFHLNSDYIRSYIIDNPAYTKEEHKRVFGFMDDLAYQVLQSGISVIYDFNATKYKYRKDLMIIARSAGATPYTLEIKTPLPVAEERIRTRTPSTKRGKRFYKKIRLEVLHGLKNEMERIRKNENVIQIDGTKSFKEQ